jgi:hypothetical protein
VHTLSYLHFQLTCLGDQMVATVSHKCSRYDSKEEIVSGCPLEVHNMAALPKRAVGEKTKEGCFGEGGDLQTVLLPIVSYRTK